MARASVARSQTAVGRVIGIVTLPLMEESVRSYTSKASDPEGLQILCLGDLDALAWVMGKQGVKNLCGDKMEDVIFAETPGAYCSGGSR